MAKYTIEISKLIKNNFDFGLLNYPIFDEDYREVLNKNILNYYYNYEIGFETPELFKFYLNNKLSLIMPMYNEMYKQYKNILDNLSDNTNIKESYEGVNDSKTDNSSISNSNSNSISNNKNLHQDTPQGNFGYTELEDQKYASDFVQNKGSNVITDETKNNSNIETNATNNYIKTIIGRNNSKIGAEVLNDIKNNLFNIDILIISELNDLFMGVM